MGAGTARGDAVIMAVGHISMTGFRASADGLGSGMKEKGRRPTCGEVITL